MLAGENGILTRTTDAKEKSDIAQIQEEIQLAWNAVQVDGITKGWDSSAKAGALNTELFKEDGNASASWNTTNSVIDITYKGYTTTINPDTGAMSLLAKAGETPATPTPPPPAVNTEWEIVTDTGTEGLSVGDLIAPTVTGVTTEKFYVIGIDGNGVSQTVRLLARYCVDTTISANAQDPEIGIFDTNQTYTTAGAVVFGEDSNATNANVYATSYIKGLVDTYVSKLTTSGLTLEDVETVEGGNSVTGVKGRLMWGTATGNWNNNYTIWTYVSGTGELGSLLDAGLTDIVYGPSGGRLSYWLGSPNTDDGQQSWGIEGYRYNVYALDVDIDSFQALRPVIKILASKIS